MNTNNDFNLPDDLGFRFELASISSQLGFIENEIYQLRWYFRTLEEMINQEEEKQVHKIEASTKGNIDWSEDYPYWWQTIFATQLRFSFIIWAIAVLEHNLKDLCQSCARAFAKEWTDPRQETVRQARRFLVGIGLSRGQSKLWEKFERQ